MANIFQLNALGASQVIKKQEYPGMLWGILLWQSLSLDEYAQYFAGSSWGGRGMWYAHSALEEARKLGGVAVKRFETGWPMGTVIGVRTMNRANNLVDSLQKLNVPVVAVRPDFFGGGVGELDVGTVKALAPNGFVADLVIFGTYYNRVEVGVRIGPNGQEYVYRDVLIEQFGAPACEYMINNTPPEPCLYYIQLAVGIKNPGIPDMPVPTFYHLIHEKKINAEIYPPHDTILFPGQQVHIIAEPIADRTLTEFTVQSEDKLTEATQVYTDVATKGITTPYGYDDPKKANYIYGPVNSDVYVTAVAEGIEIEETIKAGVEATIQMTTTDCLVEPGSWKILGSNFPPGVAYSIDDDGLISILVPEDVYEGNPGGIYYIDVEFTGYSQTKGVRLVVTVDEVAAYGTVWTASATLPDTPIAIFEDSAGKLYLTTANTILRSDDAETFEAVPTTGAITGVFGNVAEGPGGRLLLAEEDGGIWVKEPSDEGFTKQAWAAPTSYWNYEPIWLSAHPDSDVFLHGGTNYLGTQQRLVARDTSTGAILHIHDDGGIYQGHARPGVLLPDGSWLITFPSYSYKVFRYTRADGFVELISGTAEESENLLYREANGRVVFMGGKNSTNDFIRTSSDSGINWSAETLTAKPFLVRTDVVIPLKRDYLVYGGSDATLYRSTDLRVSNTAVKSLPGVVNWLLKRSTGVLIALARTNTDVNVWKSEA